MKELPTIKCPACGKKITREDLGYAQEGTMIYRVYCDREGEVDFEEDEFDSDEGGEFYHSGCKRGGGTIDYKDLKRLGVNY